LVSLIEQVQQQLDPNTLAQLSRQLGVDEQTTRQAVPAAVTALVGGLGRNASRPEGAQQIASALDRDHDGSILDNLGGFLGQGGAGGIGGAILGHVLGRHQRQVETGLGQSTGLDAAKIGQLLALLAPIVMAVLGRQKREQGIDAGGLGEILKGEHQNAQRHAEQSGLGGILGGLLDRDGDGGFLDDLAGMAGGFLGGGKK
jgi:hypothetical protein